MFKKKIFSIKNKIVLVTGASSGIGEATAIEFAKKGARIALIARDNQKLEKIKNIINSDYGEAEYFPFDLLKIDNIVELIQQVEEYFNDTVDVLVNSAGKAVLGLVENVSVDAYKENLQLNYFAPLRLIQCVLPGMKKKRAGQVINLFSGVGKRGLPGVSPYCVTKFALNGLTESLRVEVSQYNIDVILFSPGLVQTDFKTNQKIYGKLKETFANGKTVTAELVADRIVKASIKRKRDVILSFKTMLGIHVNYWFPALLDKILAKKL
jgi:short-subunit dehydrogenase